MTWTQGERRGILVQMKTDMAAGNPRFVLTIVTGLTLSLGANTSKGQWTATSLHPPGTTASICRSGSGTQQAGMALVGGRGHASLWNGTASSWIDVHPPGTTFSNIDGIGDGQQVGYVDGRASLWSGTATSWVDLNPTGFFESYATAVSGGQQVGFVPVAGEFHASLWSGTASSWVDLNPSGATKSYAYACGGGKQAGFAEFDGFRRASLWSGTAASWTDLSPQSATASYVYATDGVQQVGTANVGNALHASLWIGTAASWVDLNPSGVNESFAYAVCDGHQAGYARVAGEFHASLWSGTAASWVDLHAFLPPGFANSHAQGLSRDDNYLYVSGYGYNSLTATHEALLWTKRICSTPSVITQPSTSISAPNSVASLNIVAEGTQPLAYQWRRGEVNLTDGGRIAGANSPTLSISNVQPSDQGTYDCVVADSCSSLQSNAVQLSCKAALSSQPIGGTFKAGRQIVLSASHPPAGSVTYRWKKDGANLFNAGTYSGVTTPTLTINTTDPSQTGSYALSITNVCGIAVSNAALVEVVCGADLDNGSGTGTPDGGVDITDLLYFLGAFEAGSPAADLDNGTGNGVPDGGIDINDLLYFLLHFEAGC